MARKQVNKVQATADEKKSRPVRLVLPDEDVDRLEAVARAKGLSNASYVRMVVLKAIKEDEKGGE